MKTKIAITDDHPMVLQGIQSLLKDTDEVLVVGTYGNAKETLERIHKDAPDILLLDINLPDINGIEVCKVLRTRYKMLKILALSNFDELSYVKRMLRNGANGYLLKNTDRVELITAFKTVLAGDLYISDDIVKKLLNYQFKKKKHSRLITKLTRREHDVLISIYEELTTQEISEKLFISPKTVETHRMNIMSKLGAKNCIGVIKTAIENDLL